MEELSVQEWLFVGEYLRSGNASEAARVAEMGGAWPGAEGWRILRIPKVRAEIDRCTIHACKAAELTVKTIVQDIVNVLTADTRELVEQRNGSCRHCWGVENRYQFKAQEWRDALIKDQNADPLGGTGYMRRIAPNPACPECEGEGVTYTVIHDSRDLSPEAAALYVGMRPTKNGIEVKMRCKDAARAAAAMYLGMNKQDLNVNLTEKKPEDMTNEELAALIESEREK